MKHLINIEKHLSQFTVRQMKPGDIGELRTQTTAFVDIILKTLDGAVSLITGAFYRLEIYEAYDVKLIPVGSTLTLTVGGLEK